MKGQENLTRKNKPIKSDVKPLAEIPTLPHFKMGAQRRPREGSKFELKTIFSTPQSVILKSNNFLVLLVKKKNNRPNIRQQIFINVFQ